MSTSIEHECIQLNQHSISLSIFKIDLRPLSNRQNLAN